jgi:hypothetical protein
MVLVGPTLLLPSVPAKVVLKALSTREDGSPAATSAAAELSGDTTSESKVSKFSGLVVSTMVLPARCSPYLSTMSCSAGYGTAKITMSPLIGPGESALRM